VILGFWVLCKKLFPIRFSASIQGICPPTHLQFFSPRISAKFMTRSDWGYGGHVPHNPCGYATGCTRYLMNTTVGHFKQFLYIIQSCLSEIEVAGHVAKWLTIYNASTFVGSNATSTRCMMVSAFYKVQWLHFSDVVDMNKTTYTWNLCWILFTKNCSHRLIFDWVIQKNSRWTFLEQSI